MKRYFYFSNIKLFPFLKDIKRYKVRSFKNDLFAAFSVALLTIPQSIAYSILAGLPLSAGLFSAIFGSIFVGAFGSSKHLIAGPTTAIAILLQTSLAEIMHQYYPSVVGADKDVLILSLLSHIVLIIGCLQILFGLFNMGKVLQFVSRSVILGYFVGVIIAIIVNQLFPFFGISSSISSGAIVHKIWDLITNIDKLSLITTACGISGVLLLILFKKKIPKFPNALLMLIIISLFSYVINTYFVSYIGGDKQGVFHVMLLQDMGLQAFPVLHFKFPILSFDILYKVFPIALAITMLGILEVFSVSRTVATKSSQVINSNQEIFSFGLANTILSFLFGTMPASGSASRSLFNYNNKAKTRFSAIFSGVIVLLFILLFWPLARHIPLVGLSAILLVIVPSFVDYTQLKLCFTVTKGDGVVFILTVLSCLVFSLHIALFIGIAMSIVTYLKRAAVPHLVEYAFNSSGRLVIVSQKKRVSRKVRIIGIAGELFFGSVDLFQITLQRVSKDPHVRAVVLRLNNVYYVDASMCYAILHLNEYLALKKKTLIISGITNEIWEVFIRSGITKQVGEENLFFTDEVNPQLSTWNACLRAKDLVT